MLNNKNDLSMIPTINNDGHSYIIPMDMYKEGYWAYNISNYFKARVDDNGTPFMIRWYKHGQLANVLNLRPFIRGRVGGYTIDDSNATADPKIVMDENASSVDWTGETTDTQAGGIAIYRTINQCYPQNGIFYGQVGLRSSDGDTVVTGIDIIFKVLDGNINMLGAKKYYVSELTKALLDFEAKMDQHDRDYQAKLTQQEQEYQAKMDQNDKDFKSKTDQLIADARAAYTKETQNTHDALTAAQAQIQANRDEQADLSNRLAGTEQQIKIHNVATLDQFATLSKQAFDRLSSIGAQPQYYDTVEAMKAANPDGTNNLCETVEDGHRWLYINGVWQDCGAVKDNAFKAAYDASHDLLYGQDIRDWGKSQTGKVVEATEDFARYQDMPIMHLNIDNIDDYAYLSSDIIKINHDLISIQFPEMIKNVDQPNVVSMEVRQLKPADNPNDTSTFANNSLWFHFGDSQMTLNKIPDIKLNPDTDRIQFVYQIHGGTGDVYVGKPVINYGSQCIPYSPLQLVQDAQIAENSLTDGILNASQNLMYNQTIENWTPQINGVAAISNDPLVQFANTPIMHIEEKKAGSVNSFTSKNIDVKSNVISVQLPNKVVGEDFNNSHVYFTIFPLADNEAVGDQIVNKKAISFPLGNTSMGLSKFENVTLPDGTKQIALGVNQEGVGHLFFGIPAVNYGPKCIAYSPSSIASDFDQLSKRIDNNFKIVQANSQNLLFGQDIRNWNNSVLGEVSLATDGDKQFNGAPIMHIKGTETGQWNNWVSDPIEINNNIISLQLPEMIENEDFSHSSVYLSISPIATGEKMGDDSVNKKTKSFALGNTELSLSKFENITLPSDTKQIVISFTQYGLGDLYFGIPTVNYGTSCISYNQLELAKEIEEGNASIPQLRINANNNEYGYDKEAVPFKLVQKSGITYGYLLFDIQGDSSRGYPKKNFKIKLFSDPDGKKKLKLQLLSSWPKTNKYNIKANWIDATQSRNIVSARLVKDALTVTGLEKAEQTKSLLQTEGLGQINGVPVELYFDDGYYGLCTLNTKKEDSTFGMDSKNVEQEVLSTEVSQADFMNSTKNIDGTDWSTEIHDTATDDIKANLKVFQDFVTNSSDVDFKAKIHDYIDVKSVMVEILYGWLSHEWDYYSKSELLATWNAGKYWYLIPYDMDSTWGLHWNGSKVDIDDDWFSFDKANSSDTAIINNQNQLHERVVKMFTPELKALGQQLRATAWSNQAIIERFKRFIDGVPAEVYKKNAGRWPDIPSLKTTSFGQIQSAVIQRGQEFDNFISKI